MDMELRLFEAEQYIEQLYNELEEQKELLKEYFSNKDICFDRWHLTDLRDIVAPNTGYFKKARDAEDKLRVIAGLEHEEK